MKLQLCLLLAAILIGCGENDPTIKQVGSEPQARSSARSEESPANVRPVGEPTEPRGIQLTVFVPPESSIPDDVRGILESRLLAVLTSGGFGGTSASSAITLVPTIQVTSKNITATAPPMHAVSFDLALHIVDLGSGIVFASAIEPIKGVGRDRRSALVNALSSVTSSSPELRKVVANARTRILDHFQTNCSSVINEARRFAQQGEHARALGLLRAIPVEAAACYQQAQEIAGPIIEAALAADCGKFLTSMKSELGNRASTERGGYNARAMAAYAMIPSSSPCRRDAEAVYAQYMSSLDRDAQDRWTREEREFEERSRQRDSDNEYRTLKAELEAKVAVEGQTALLKKYHKDYEYGKLPWLRKLLHLGKYDPFDEPLNQERPQ